MFKHFVLFIYIIGIALNFILNDIGRHQEG